MPKEPHYPGESEEYPEYEPAYEEEAEEIVEEEPKESHYPELEEELEKLKEKKALGEEKRALKEEKKGLQREIRRTKYEPLYEAGGKVKEFGIKAGEKTKELGIELGEKGKEAFERFRGTPEQRAERKERAKRVIGKLSSSLGTMATRGVSYPKGVMDSRPATIPEGIPEVSPEKNVLAEDYLMKEQPMDKMSQLIPGQEPQQPDKMTQLLPQGGQGQGLGFDIFGRGQQPQQQISFGRGSLLEGGRPEDILFARREMTAERPQRQIRRKESVAPIEQKKGIESLIDIGRGGGGGELGLGGKGELLEFGSGRPIDLDLKPTQIGGGTDKVFGGFGGETKEPMNLGFGGGGNIFGGGGNKEITKDGVMDFIGINKSQDIFSKPPEPVPEVRPVRRMKHKRRK